MGERYDAVVIGARLAGASAGAHLARAGRSVLVLDRSSFPSDQLSTHLLMPARVDELRRMGALDAILAANPTRSPWLELVVDDGTDHAARTLERWRACGPPDYCLCVPRTIQDVELVRTARAGADVRERHRFLDMHRRGGRAVGVRYADLDGAEHEVGVDLVLGADGRRSAVAAAVGAHRPYRASRNGRALVFRYIDDPLAAEREGHTIYQWRDGDSMGFLFPSARRRRRCCCSWARPGRRPRPAATQRATGPASWPATPPWPGGWPAAPARPRCGPPPTPRPTSAPPAGPGGR